MNQRKCMPARNTSRMIYSTFIAIIVLSAVLFAHHSSWGQTAAQAPANEKKLSHYDNIWKLAEWYNNSENPVLQSLQFSGRFHADYAALDTDHGSHDEWNVRRLRLGARARLFGSFTLHGEADFNPQEAEPFYLRITDMNLQWRKNGRFTLTMGKHAVSFTMDGSTSSNELLTIDRNNLSNNMWFPQEYMSGVSASGKVSAWIYRAGIYSAGTANKEFGEFNGSYMTLASLGYDFANSMGVKEALLSGNYVFQNPDPRNTFTRQLRHVVSTNFKFETSRWGLRTDVSAAAGYLGQSNLWGLMAMPFVNATDKLQFVCRYTMLYSEMPNGVRLATYESRIVPGRGNHYDKLYLGANHYFYGHKLKLQSGVQFAGMDDSRSDGGEYSGVSWTTGLRVGW